MEPAFNILFQEQTAKEYDSQEKPAAKYKPVPIGELPECLRLALIQLYDSPLTRNQYGDCIRFKSSDVYPVTPGNLRQLVYFGHILSIGNTVRASKRTGERPVRESTYRLKPVSIAMVADWKRK